MPIDTTLFTHCPLCHTPHPSQTPEAIQADDDWQCARCGQHWQARRLEAVAAYAVWSAVYDSPERTRANHTGKAA